MSVRVHLTEPGAPIEPGGEGVAAVTVVNTSQVVMAYRLDLVGATGWAFVEPRELRLFPEQAGDALVHFRPPKTPEVVSGVHDFAVKVTATEDAATSVVEEASVTVAPFVAAELTIRPKTARGTRKAKYRLTLTNTGNTRQRFDLVAADEDDMLQLKLSDDVVALDPGESKAVPLVARIIGRISRGERLPFTATVQGPGLTPTSTNGALAIAPAIGPWAARAAVAALALAVVIGAFLLTRNDEPKTTARDFRTPETTTTSTVSLTTVAGVPGETTVAQTVPPGGGGDTTAAGPGATPPPATPPPTPPTTAPKSGGTTAPTTPPTTRTTTPPTTLAPAPPATVAAKWAQVTATADFWAGNGGTGLITGGFGQYHIGFNSDISQCAYTASPGGAHFTGGPAPYIALVARENATTVYVEIKNLGGGLSAAPFMVMVTCPGMASSYAVVTSAGAVNRQSNVVSVTKKGTGLYRLNLAYDATPCTAVATVGDPGDNANIIDDIFNPKVATIVGTGPKFVDVQVRATGSGAKVDGAFHAVVRCGPFAANGTLNGVTVLNGTGFIMLGPDEFRFPGVALDTCAVIADTADTGAGATTFVDLSNFSSARLTTYAITNGAVIDPAIQVHLAC